MDYREGRFGYAIPRLPVRFLAGLKGDREWTDLYGNIL